MPPCPLQIQQDSPGPEYSPSTASTPKPTTSPCLSCAPAALQLLIEPRVATFVLSCVVVGASTGALWTYQVSGGVYGAAVDLSGQWGETTGVLWTYQVNGDIHGGAIDLLGQWGVHRALWTYQFHVGFRLTKDFSD